jgi:hypothetical protein
VRYIGMDAHKGETQVCIIDADGTLVLETGKAVVISERGRIVAELGRP